MFHMLLSAQIRGLLAKRMTGEGEGEGLAEEEGGSNEWTQSSIVGCGMKPITQRRG